MVEKLTETLVIHMTKTEFNQFCSIMERDGFNKSAGGRKVIIDFLTNCRNDYEHMKSIFEAEK